MSPVQVTQQTMVKTQLNSSVARQGDPKGGPITDHCQHQEAPTAGWWAGHQLNPVCPSPSGPFLYGALGNGIKSVFVKSRAGCPRCAGELTLRLLAQETYLISAVAQTTTHQGISTFMARSWIWVWGLRCGIL